MTQHDDVRAGFNYTKDDGVVPEVWFYEPDPGTAIHSPGDDPHQMLVRDGWPQVQAFDLDRQGFALREFANEFRAFDDNGAIERVFYPQVAEFVRSTIGARRVHIFDHTIRSKVNAAQQTAEHTTTQRAPVMLVHCDYTPKSAPLRVRQVLPQEADDLLSRRVVFINFWKPLYRRVEEKPLAMCDVGSTHEGDLLRMNLRYRDRTGEIYVMRHSPDHQWWYFPNMEREHTLLLKTYDSETDGRARFMGHSAFDHPGTREDAATRESIEIRTMAFF